MENSEWTSFFEALELLVTKERLVPVRASANPKRAVDALNLKLPRNGRPLSEVLTRLVKIGEATPNTASNQFFNQLFGGRITAATMADMLAALFNNSMYTYKVAGPHVLVENEVLHRMLNFAGYATGEGTFTPGGSMSNLLAMIIARGEVFADSREAGMTGLRPTAYTSAQGHYSIRKNAGLLGIGRQQVRAVAADRKGRMKPDALRDAITRDVAEGYHPFFLNLTAGTTVLGAFDPLAPLTAVGRDFGLWVHVDGALGGSMLVSAQARDLLAGIESTDSLTWDAHKTMGVPLTSSVCLVRRHGLLGAHLSERADYLFQDDEPRLDPGQTSMQCGRRNDALKLWAAWQTLGDVGYGRRIDRMLELAAYAAERVRATRSLRLFRAPESINVCFTVDGATPADLCSALLERQRAVVGHATVEGQPIVRLVCVNPDLAEADIDRFFENVLITAAELKAESGRPALAG